MGFQKGHKDFVSKESRQKSRSKISDALKGRIISVEARKKASDKLKGKPTWWMKLGLDNPMKGKKTSENLNHRLAMSKLKGAKCHLWRGGITSLSATIRRCFKYRLWRSDVFTRDGYVCQTCGIKGGQLHADHYPKTFASLIKENNIKNVNSALECEELWNINNGRTLCVDCHKKTETFLNNKKRDDKI